MKIGNRIGKLIHLGLFEDSVEQHMMEKSSLWPKKKL